MTRQIPRWMSIHLSSNNAEPLASDLRHGPGGGPFGVAAVVDGYPGDGEDYAGVKTGCYEAGSCYERD